MTDVWLANGVRLGILIDPDNLNVFLYCPGQAVVELDQPDELACDPEVPRLHDRLRGGLADHRRRAVREPCRRCSRAARLHADRHGIVDLELGAGAEAEVWVTGDERLGGLDALGRDDVAVQ